VRRKEPRLGEARGVPDLLVKDRDAITTTRLMRTLLLMLMQNNSLMLLLNIENTSNWIDRLNSIGSQIYPNERG
jgi:hypothetical protein